MTNNHWYLNADESFKQKAALYAAVTKGQADLDKDKFKLALKHWPRTIMKALITECQAILLNALQHNVQGDWHADMDECIKDYFAKTGKAYGQAYLAYQGLWSLSCLDVNQIDAGFNLSTMPANTLTANHPDELDQEARHLPPSLYENDQLLTAGIYDETHTDSYQSVIYEQSGYEIYSTTKVFKIEPSKDSKQPEVVTLKISHGEPKALTPPPGFAYLKQLVKQGLPIAKTVMPSQAATSKTKAHSIYLNAEGQYNGEALHQAQQALNSVLGQSAQDTVTQSLSHAANHLDGLLDNLSQLAGMGDQAEPDAGTKLKAKQAACAYICDAAGVTRDAVQVGSNGGELLSEAMVSNGLAHYQAEQKTLAEKTKALPGNSLYQVPSTGEICDTYQQAESKISALQTQSTKDLSDVAPKAKHPIYIKKGVLEKQVGVHFGLCALALLDVRSAYQSANQQPDFYTITSLGLKIADALKETNELVENAAKLFGKAEALAQLKAKHSLINALTGERYLKESANALECIGLVGSVFNMVTSTIDWATSCGNNDSALTASNFMGMLSNDLFLLGGIKQVAEKQKAEAAVKTSSKDAISSFAEEAARKTGDEAARSTAESLLSKAGEGIADLCEAIGDCIPGVDVICWIATAAQIAGLIISLFEDNLYQQWAKKSKFISEAILQDNATDEQAALASGAILTESEIKQINNHHAFKDNEEAYAALLSLIASPRASIKLDPKRQSDYYVSLTSLAPQLDADHGHLNLNAYVTTQGSVSYMSASNQYVTSDLLAPVTINPQPIYLANTLSFVGQRAVARPIEGMGEIKAQVGLDNAYGESQGQDQKPSSLRIQAYQYAQHSMHCQFELYAAGNIQYSQFSLPNRILKSEHTSELSPVPQYFVKHAYAYTNKAIALDPDMEELVMIAVNTRLQNSLEDNQSLIQLSTSVPHSID